MFLSSFIQVCPASQPMVTEGQHTRKIFSQLMSTIKIHIHNLGAMFQYEMKMQIYTKNIGHWDVFQKLDLEFFFPECGRICADHFMSSYYYCNSHYRQVPMPRNQSLSMEPIRGKRHVKRLKPKPHFSRLLLCHQSVEFRCPDTRPKP